MIQSDDLEQHMDVLYAELQPQLVRIVARQRAGAGGVIEDACQSAWGSLLVHRQAVAAGTELGWLSTTATREALRLLRSDRRSPPLPRWLSPFSLDAYRAADSGPGADARVARAPRGDPPPADPPAARRLAAGLRLRLRGDRRRHRRDPANRGPSVDPSPAAPGATRRTGVSAMPKTQVQWIKWMRSNGWRAGGRRQASGEDDHVGQASGDAPGQPSQGLLQGFEAQLRREIRQEHPRSPEAARDVSATAGWIVDPLPRMNQP